MHLPIVNLNGEPDPLELVEARGLAVAAAAAISGLGDHTRIVQLAAPLITWLGQAASGEDLFARAEAVKRYTEAVDRGAVTSAAGDGAELAGACAAIYAVLAGPGVRAGALPVGRALYAVRNLLLAGTEPGQLDPARPGPTWDALVACAARFEDQGDGALAPQEYAAALRLVMGSSPRPGPAGSIPEDWVVRAQLQWILGHRAFPATDPDPTLALPEPEPVVRAADLAAVLEGRAWHLPPHPRALYAECVACGFPIVPGTTDRFDIFIVEAGFTLADHEQTELAGAAVPAAAASAFRRQHPDAQLVLHVAADPAAEAARHAWEAVAPCMAAGPGGCLSCHPDEAVWWAGRWRPGGSAAGRSPDDNPGPAALPGPDPSPVTARPAGDVR